MSRSESAHGKEVHILTIEELAERIWDQSYSSIAELQSDLTELYEEGREAGYAEAVARVKESAKKLIQKEQ